MSSKVVNSGISIQSQTIKKNKHNSLNKHPEVVKLKKEQVQELNHYLEENRFYAYNDPKKFEEGMRMLGLNLEDIDKVVDVAGGAMRADKIPEPKELIARQKADLRNLKNRLMAEMNAAN